MALGRRGVLQRGRLRRTSASGPLRLPELPCTRTGSVTLRSWLRRLPLLLSQQRGGRERLLGVSSPARLSRCRLLSAKEKSLCWRVGRFTSVKATTFVPALTFPSLSGARVCPGSAQNKKGFSNYPSCFHRHASCHEHTLSHSHSYASSRKSTHRHFILSHMSLNSHKQQYVKKHIDEAGTIFRLLFYSLNPLGQFSL